MIGAPSFGKLAVRRVCFAYVVIVIKKSSKSGTVNSPMFSTIYANKHSFRLAVAGADLLREKNIVDWLVASG